MQKVTVTIDTNGKPTIKVEGIAGQSCKVATEPLEKALGVVRADKLTADYHKREAVRHVQRQ